ncbi:hypothetical protein ACI76O_02795 [Capnocytophaga cynodegmi]|uniref:hypothetical protein n=1 Tax=Capnocytophaga cynodegmi TaxID=28189 RepID=UPI00385E5E6C
MENQINFFREDNQKLEVTSFIKENLSQTAKWAKFLAIVGFVGLVIVCLIAVLMLTLGTFISYHLKIPFNPGILGVTYLIIVLVYFFPLKYLYDFSVKMKKALNFTDNQAFSESFSALKSHYKFIGIFTIVIISMYLISFLMIFAGILFGGVINQDF